jgi:predicted DCC family thiol-disulfide oxidoreductase YuxK
MKSLIIFYDGPCVLCNYWIQKLCQWDKENHFKFTSLDSKFAIDFFSKNPSPILKKDAIISWDFEKGYHAEAEAVFRILTSLKGFFNFFLIFNLLPKSLTNSIYRFIAKNRYRWFGKHAKCPLPDKKFTYKFL